MLKERDGRRNREKKSRKGREREEGVGRCTGLHWALTCSALDYAMCNELSISFLIIPLD